MTSTAVRRLRRAIAAGPIGALIGVGLAVVPTSTVQATVVHHTKAAEVAGPLDGAEVRALPFETRHAALYWEGNPGAEVTVAFGVDGMRFGPSVTVEHDEVGMQRQNGQTYGALLSAGGATTARVTSDRPLGRLTIVALREDGTSIQEKVVPAGQARAQTATDGVVSREGWGADEKHRFDRRGKEVWPPVFQTVQKLVVHHTAGANDQKDGDARSTIRSIYYYHAVTQGWGDIGYNFLIDAGGVVYKGRHSHEAGSTVDTVTGENAKAQGVTAAHAYGYNSGSVGVAMLGTYTSVDAPLATKTALKNFLVAKATAHGLDPAREALYTNPVNGTQKTFENVPGHREVPDNATDCPGTYFHSYVLPQMRSDMQLMVGTPDTTKPRDPTDVSASPSRRAAIVGWKESPGDTGTGTGGTSGVAGYDVLRRLPGEMAMTYIGSTTGTTFTDDTRVRGVVYEYVVQTYDGASNRSDGVKAPEAV
ncbi:MAG TPA: N-acetylmuramoyl-L-alanine amidase [Acidimicrobiales bacterium]|nr:N-acetylmuramoyl-L-alanine amidase [Acidimicrobiales bacterium]